MSLSLSSPVNFCALVHCGCSSSKAQTNLLFGWIMSDANGQRSVKWDSGQFNLNYKRESWIYSLTHAITVHGYIVNGQRRRWLNRGWTLAESIVWTNDRHHDDQESHLRASELSTLNWTEQCWQFINNCNGHFTAALRSLLQSLQQHK